MVPAPPAGMSRGRFLVAAFGDPGHAFPAISLARALGGRGHAVVVETWERWRGPVEELGLGFTAAEEYKTFPPPPPDGSDGPGVVEAAAALAPLLEDLRPDVVVSDILTVAPALAAEIAGRPLATLVPHLWPVHDRGLPFFALGVQPPRTAAGRLAWRAAGPALAVGLRRGRRELNEARARLGLAPVERFHGGISTELALVGTFPQLEYPRRWPAEAWITGPLCFELPHPEIELPDGDGPLVLVAPSTAKDPECGLLRAALEGLAEEPVRVVATSNGHLPREPIEAPPNARLAGWLSYGQVMPEADLVICHGGHGTVARALAAGVPVLVSPASGDMAETGARVGWAGCGLMVPARLRRPGPLRWAARRMLGRGSEPFRERARELADWARRNEGAERAAALVEDLGCRRG